MTAAKAPSASDSSRPEIVVSGARPTGKLHLGHLNGALKNWLQLQQEYKCFFFVADWHALTTEYADPAGLRANAESMVLDWLAVGVDPERAILFSQSDVPAHAELFVMFSMIVPVPWLERVPTYKEQQEQLEGRDLSTYGFLGYPLLQAADILVYKATSVPVGEDQLPHVELTREVARRFNRMYGEVFPEPKGLVMAAARVPGTDGRKMSKSYGNAVDLTDDPRTVYDKLSKMVTDVEASASHGSRRPQGLSGVSPARDLLHGRGARRARGGVQDRGDRLSRLQEGDDPARGRGARADSAATSPAR